MNRDEFALKVMNYISELSEEMDMDLTEYAHALEVLKDGLEAMADAAWEDLQEN